MTVTKAMQKVNSEFELIYGDEIQDIRLEELDNNLKKGSLEITVSFLLPDKNPIQGLASTMSLGSRTYDRLYKKIIIDKKKEEIVSMKIPKNG